MGDKNTVTILLSEEEIEKIYLGFENAQEEGADDLSAQIEYDINKKEPKRIDIVGYCTTQYISKIL